MKIRGVKTTMTYTRVLRRGPDGVRTFMKAVLGALIPLRVNIATLVSLLLVLVAGAIVVNDQITGRRAALTQVKASFQSHNETVRLELEALNGPVETVVRGNS